MKEIQLSQGKVALVDDEDFEYLNQWKWHFSSRGYAMRRAYKKNIHMHRAVFRIDEKLQCDHINGNRIDNRKSNLRPCTQNENMMNKKAYKNNKTGYKGVNFQNGKYHASISILGKKTHLGHFKTAEEAARKYDEAAIQKFGIFARLNFR